MRINFVGLLVGAGLLVLPVGGSLEAVAGDSTKRRYSFFAPTPDHLMRDMSTDRPDATESPFTIDAGHAQVETNIFGFSRSTRDSDGFRTDTYEIGTTNIRIGVTSFAELNLVWQPYGVVQTSSLLSGPASRSSGIGSVDIRGKINLWGNDLFGDLGTSAFALLPFVTLPTDRSNDVSAAGFSAGLIVPFALQLSDKIGFGLNAGFVSTKSEETSSYRTEYLVTAAVSYEWTDRLGSYYEVGVAFETDDPRGDAVFLGTGLTYAVNSNTQLDIGLNVGVSPAADRINPFIGISRRF
ncbi:conserved exported protein of unknown function [Candidatus Filomicrobium marinum]|uniref:Transporter n=1 Tax=Candidatus Filomicrobium marinum TaxID=1608628 RepID=A0A0D6JH95_9HYPH|nr:transporter [Candidatus Filomicrobium marinum]CFX50745.1 conserved exported protein of unknown function [Candidatus Filomicrobium marinum]CPR20198.1 conserved exported protein of unknown function [Candidatus Filomicrobium marinum]